MKYWYRKTVFILRFVSLKQSTPEPCCPSVTKHCKIRLNFPLPSLLTSVLVCEHLSWNAHTASISKNIASGIGAIKCCRRPFVPTETLKHAYDMIVQPHFDYCDVVWGNCNAAHASKLQKLQNRAAGF